MTITSHLVVYQNNEYTISSTGWIPAVKITDDIGSILVIVTKALEFNFQDKTVTWLVEEFAWNILLNKWIKTTTGKFNTVNGLSIMTITNDLMVDSVTGVYTITNAPMAEIEFYLANLAIPIMYPAIQNALNYKLNN
jgi:hypothetical protein